MIDLTRRQFFVALLSSALASGVRFPIELTRPYSALPEYDPMDWQMIDYIGPLTQQLPVPRAWLERPTGTMAVFQMVEQVLKEDPGEGVSNQLDEHGLPTLYDPREISRVLSLAPPEAPDSYSVIAWGHSDQEK